MSTPKGIIERECTLVLELATPLHIGSGEPDGGSDAGVVRDFNGLPGIPGTSIQGMLRAAVEEACRVIDSKAANRIFGHTSKSNQGTGRGGRLTVSWGIVHNSKNSPASAPDAEPEKPQPPKRLTATERDKDEVLRDAARPMLRDHVRLTDRGVAAKRAKFDELVVSAGHRFTVKLRFITASQDETEKVMKEEIDSGTEDDWRILESVLRDPNLRLGGKTRRGLGAFRIVEPKALEQSGAGCGAETIFDGKLSPETLWMFGGGTSESADSAPVSGTRILWTKGPDNKETGSVQPIWVIPGSAVKGALRHRTMFHANRLAGNFADKRDGVAEKKAKGWMDELFGDFESAKDEVKCGKVFIDDTFIDIPSANGTPAPSEHLAPVQNHVAINPFTGGAKDSALFNDEPLKPSAGVITLNVQLRGAVSNDARKALKAALDDLAAGRLALGAHAGRGYGFFKQQAA